VAITSIIFDAEGVVIKTHHIWHDSTTKFLAKRGVAYTHEVSEKLKPLIVGRSVAEGAQIMQEMFGFEGDPNEMGDERLWYAQERFAMDVEFIPGFLDFFHTVSQIYNTCIGSAMRDEFMQVIKASMPLEELFGKRIYTLGHGNGLGKPDPTIFLHCAKQLGSEPEECVVIEDAPNGIEAAHRAGMKCVGITTAFRREQLSGADQVVDRFDEIDLSTLLF